MNSIVKSIKSFQSVKSVKTMSVLEIALLVLFVIYIIFPVSTPDFVAPMVVSPLGILAIFCVTISLFLFSNPILGVIYIFVAYELLRRSSMNMGNVNTSKNSRDAAENTNTTRTTRTIPTSQQIKNVQLQNMNAVGPMTLEEEIISVEVPLNKNQQKVVETEYNFLPVADKIISGASLY